MKAVKGFLYKIKSMSKKNTDNLIQRCQRVVVFVAAELVLDSPLKGTWLKGKKGCRKPQRKRGETEKNGRAGKSQKVEKELLKETHIWSLKDGKEGKEEEKLQERKWGGKNESNYSGGIGMERGGKFQGKRLESRQRLSRRRMRAGWGTNWPLKAHLSATFQVCKEGVSKGCVRSKSDVDSTGKKSGIRWERMVLWIRH